MNPNPLFRTAPGSSASNSLAILGRIGSQHSKELRAAIIEGMITVIQKLSAIDNPKSSFTLPLVSQNACVREENSEEKFVCSFVLDMKADPQEIGFMIEEAYMLRKRFEQMHIRAVELQDLENDCAQNALENQSYEC